ncbi:MAG: disulfide bond formation protein B [Candidatus Levybacteria bacterium]|nr:disulfide bond formation protein B [Candidatus Levybacteria bacterium]
MSFLKKNLLQFALIISLTSTLGSLYFSEILKLPPCLLCWYQRIFMYPLVVIFAVGIIKKDKNIPYFALPLSIIGLVIAAYHNLLYYKIIPESLEPCTIGISCTTKQIEWLGFITIPFLSLVSFIAITVIMLLFKKYSTAK